ncbi:hypothetical protein ACW7BJ_33230 [Azospirillum argentinense]
MVSAQPGRKLTKGWASPYGLEIAVELMKVDDREEPMMSLESTAILLGIHDPSARRGFVEDMQASMAAGGGEMDSIVAKHGGGRVVTVALPPVTMPVYPRLPHDRHSGHACVEGVSLRDAVDSWVAALVEQPRWFDRSELLLAGFTEQMPMLNGVARRNDAGLSLCTHLTATLENLGETGIDCLEQAAFYALTAHDPWRSAGREWLMPHRNTWVHDWIKDRPVYRRLARLVGMNFPDVPSWLREVL